MKTKNILDVDNLHTVEVRMCVVYAKLYVYILNIFEASSDEDEINWLYSYVFHANDFVCQRIDVRSIYLIASSFR